MSEHVQISIENNIGYLTLNRPEKKNALTLDMLSQIASAAHDLSNDPSVRVIIFHGTGGTFCSGMDTSVLMQFAARLDEIKSELTNPKSGDGITQFQAPVMALRQAPQPVISVIDGVAFGGGIQLALAGDFRFGALDCKLSIRESKWGLIPDMGITQCLPHYVRPDQAKDLIMTGRVVDAPEAFEMGLLSQIDADPMSKALEFAQTLLTRSPEVLRASKALVDQSWHGGPEALRHEAILQSKIIGTPNQIEAAMAGMQKRDPSFSDPD